MKRPPFLRRPGKLILTSLLLAVTAGAAMLFALQVWLDAATLTQSMDAYAYVGTLAYETNQPVLADIQTAMDLAFLDEAVVERIKDSGHVTSVDIRTTKAGLAEDIVTIPDRMLTTGRLNQHYFAEGTVISRQDSMDAGDFLYEFYTLRLERQWGGNTLQPGGLYIYLYRTPADAPLEPGSRVFLIGGYMPDGNAVRTDSMIVYTPSAAANIRGQRYADSILTRNAIAVIPDGADSEQWILQYMEDTGLLALYQKYTALEKAVTVRQVSELVMHPYFCSGRIFLESGRAITPSDHGKRVCVISQGLSNRNRLYVGDNIRLAVADGCYTTSGLSPSENGWESGFPMESEEILEYGGFEEYEIIGIFSQISRDVGDPLFLSQNDIFIPAEDAVRGDVRSYNLSFRVEGTGYETFRQEIDPFLDDSGYRLKLRDTGWDAVEDTFLAIRERRGVLILSAALAFALSAGLFAVLTHRNCCYDYGLQRLLGARRSEAAREYAAAFLSAGVPGLLAAGASALAAYLLWMRPGMAEVLSVPLPTAFRCAGMLLMTAAGELLLSAFILMLLCLVQERRGLLRMIRR